MADGRPEHEKSPPPLAPGSSQAARVTGKADRLSCWGEIALLVRTATRVCNSPASITLARIMHRFLSRRGESAGLSALRHARGHPLAGRGSRLRVALAVQQDG